MLIVLYPPFPLLYYSKSVFFFSNQNYQNLPKAEFDKIRFGRGISMVLINTEGVIVFMNSHEGVEYVLSYR